MNTVIVPDWLETLAGAEKVISSLTHIYKNAEIATLVNFMSEADMAIVLKGKKAQTSFLQNMPFAKKYFRKYLPFFPLAIEQLDLRPYDTIISNSHSVAKGILKNASQLHICYCHTPMRYAWDMYFQYIQGHGLKRGIRRIIASILLHHLRTWDVVSSNRVDYFVGNSKYIVKRIEKTYRRTADYIYPPVDTKKFSLETKKENYYLTASRLVPYKKVDLIVEAFNKMPDKKLVVIGAGMDLNRIKSIAKKNIEILGFQSDEILIQYMQKAKAFVYAAEEDFGIVPVEAQACGTPVIAFGKGGILETVVDGKTGCFFKEQNPQAIIDSVKWFEKNENSFNSIEIHQHAEKFSVERFEFEFSEYVKKKQEEFFNDN